MNRICFELETEIAQIEENAKRMRQLELPAITTVLN